MKIIHYNVDHVDNPDPRGDTPDDEFEVVRQDIVATCERFGITGPEAWLDNSDHGPNRWAYFIVDDQANEELYQYAEVLERRAFSKTWLKSLMQTLSRHPGWGLGVNNINHGYILIFADRLMVSGQAFADCYNVADVVAAAKKHLNCPYESRSN